MIDQHGGWGLCQNLTDTVHFVKNRSIHIAEFWMDDQSWVIRPTSAGGAGSMGSGRLGFETRARGDQPGGRRSRGVRLLDAVRDGLYHPDRFPGGLAVGPLRGES